LPQPVDDDDHVLTIGAGRTLLITERFCSSLMVILHNFYGQGKSGKVKKSQKK